MYSITLRRHGCLSTVSLNGITVVESSMPLDFASSSGCAEAVAPGRNVLRVASWVPSGGPTPAATKGSLVVELDRFRRGASGPVETRLLTVQQAPESSDVIVAEGEFFVDDAPQLGLWQTERLDRFEEREAREVFALAMSVSDALAGGRHSDAVALSDLRFDDMSMALGVSRTNMVSIFAQGLLQQGLISAIPVGFEDMRVAVEADGRLFVLKRKGGEPLLSFTSAVGTSQVQLGVSRVSGTWVVSR